MHKIKKVLFLLVLLIPTLLTGFYIYAFSPSFVSTPTADKNNTEILPTQSFTITFDTAIDKSYYQKNISLSPRTPMKAVINDKHTQITLIPTNSWNVGTTYTVSIPNGRAKNFTQINGASFHFTVADYPRVTNVTPYSGAKDVQLDIEDPIIIQFNKSTKGFYIDFNLQPPIPVTYQNNAEKT